jgi:hypothetical protein
MLDELAPERRIDAGHRLVEQHESRLRHQHARKVEQLALAAGKDARVFACMPVEPKEREQLGPRARSPTLAPPCTPRTKHEPVPAARRVVRRAATSMLSSTDMRVSVRGTWNVRTSPRCAMR